MNQNNKTPSSFDLEDKINQANNKIDLLEKEVEKLKKKPILELLRGLSFKQRVISIAVIFSLVALVLVAGTVNKPHNFVDGTAILASQVNENFDILYNLVNGNLTTENISGIDASKITSGTLDAARLPSGSSAGSASPDRITLFQADTVDISGDEDLPLPNEIYIGSCIKGKSNLNVPGERVGIFISKSPERPIKDLITGSAAELPVYGPTDIKISDSWSELWDGSIDVSFREADITAGNFYFTGSKSDGTTDTAKICTQNVVRHWTSVSSVYVTAGDPSALDSNWINSSTSNYRCTQRLSFICYAY